MHPILVMGSGPAGASASIFLAQMGFEVVIATGKKEEGLKIGESLPPDALSLLAQLEVNQAFQQGAHEKCYGNQSIWGNDRIHYSDFIGHPLGHGWHIDRAEFEAMLIDRARRLGVLSHDQVKIASADFHEKAWDVLWGNGRKARFAFIIDATGRNSWFARRQGAERLYEDRQLALVTFLRSRKGRFDHSASLIETTGQGWWYAAKIPGDRVATAFICSPTANERANMVQAESWWSLLSKAEGIMNRIARADHEIIQAPKFLSAASGILNPVYGEGWLAVGDAALTYDPIASHGILMAMVSARDAAEAIRARLDGKPRAMDEYQQRLAWAFQNYTVRRKEFYLSERRFPGSEYWEERVKMQ